MTPPAESGPQQDLREDSREQSEPVARGWWPDCFSRKKPRRKGMKAYVHPYLMLAFGLLILPLGFTFHKLGRHMVKRSPPVRHWKKTTGEITKTWMVYKISYRGDSQTRYYFPRVSYTYRVDGRKYRSERIRYYGVPYFKSLTKAEDTLRNYAENPGVTVHYDPSNPALAVLQKRSFARVGWVIRIGGMGVMGLGVIIFLTGI
ncbi:DUF3592 domain-containing protein, partial [Myxococcota bacterium]|nr:DUF3592 domain-containing protein [Myxococcota bacterium]